MQNMAINATPYFTLATTKVSRRDTAFKNARHCILIMNGGTGDISNSHSAATILSDMSSYAMSARSAGAEKVIACTIPPFAVSGPPYLTDSSFETVRLALNALILSNAGDAVNYWEAAVDIAGDTRFQDITDATYFVDGVHFTLAGHTAAAGLIIPVLDGVLSTIPNVSYTK